MDFLTAWPLLRRQFHRLQRHTFAISTDVPGGNTYSVGESRLHLEEDFTHPRDGGSLTVVSKTGRVFDADLLSPGQTSKQFKTHQIAPD